MENLLKARNNHAYGIQRDYFDHPNCIGWTREGDDEHSGCAVAISNGDNGNKNMEIGKRYSGKKFIDMLEKSQEEVEINNDGWGNFYAPAGSVSVWIEKSV
jgi:alpha-amylase